MPQDWTDRDDAEAGACPVGPVLSAETVARLVSTDIWSDAAGLTKGAFPREALQRPVTPPKNTCGERDGESLLRTNFLGDEATNKLSDQQFGEKSSGFAVANVEQIRDIRARHDPNIQLFYVYEDPTIDIPAHAVIRYLNPGDPHAFSLARKELMALFKRSA